MVVVIIVSSHSIYLIITIIAPYPQLELSVRPPSGELTERDSIRLECKLVNVYNASGSSVLWYRNGLLLLSSSRLQIEYSEGGSVLSVPSPLPRDSGEYTCQGSFASPTGEVLSISSSAQITVTGMGVCVCVCVCVCTCVSVMNPLSCKITSIAFIAEMFV